MSNITDKTYCVSQSCPLRKKCGRHADNLPQAYRHPFMSHADLSECMKDGQCLFYEEKE